VKYGRLIEGSTKSRGKYQNPENFVLVGPKWEMENTMFNFYG
jgi:hypothetical protein